MLHLRVCLVLFHFVSVLTINAAEHNVVAYSHALWLTDQRWYTGPNESALLFELVFIVW